VFPWQDRAGRLLPLKLVVFALLFVPGGLVAWWLATGQFGGEPAKQAAREIGLWTLRLLFLSLAVTPLRAALRWSSLIQVRRMVGVAAFAYAFAHLVFYAASQGFDLAKVASEIALRIYLTIGFAALLGLGALAATSTDGMLRRLGGKRWQRLHRLAYPIALLALVHFFLQSRLQLTEPMVMAGLFTWLMLWRVWSRWRAVSVVALLSLGVLCGVGVMLSEAGYFVWKTGAPFLLVLQSNLSIDAGWRPGVVVLILGLAVTAVALLRQPRRSSISATTKGGTAESQKQSA